MREDTEMYCNVCKHNFSKYHEERERLKAWPDENVRNKCRDCRKCRDDDDKEFLNIVKGIKNPNHTAPDREPVPV